MVQLWLVPADERSFQATLASPIDLGNREDRPAEFPAQARVWGVRTDPERGSWERNVRNRERMTQGDPVLIYRKSTSRYHASGRIGPFWRTTYVRDEYWNGGPAIDVFAVEDYAEIDADPVEVNELIGYERHFHPQGLWRVSEDRPTEVVVERFDI